VHFNKNGGAGISSLGPACSNGKEKAKVLDFHIGKERMNESDDSQIPTKTGGDVLYAITKGTISSIPVFGGLGAELLELALASPLSKRRDEWMESIARRLDSVQAKLDSLAKDPAFVTTVLRATQIAIRNHAEEKLEALRNAVINTAAGRAPEDDRSTLFLNLVESFTPTHLRILKFFQNRGSLDFASIQRLANQREITDQMVLELSRSGLIDDPRPLAAINRQSPDPLVNLNWTLSTLGSQFIDFISSGS
jgi:hypothetical protein